ncbi:MAG TPA: tetratricopeptide repeat protein [Bryobacteraceae bacterium]|jgi:TolB-like protein/Flp pilus assembly protein TadD
MVGSAAFAQSDRLRRFLQFIVTETLAGRREQIKEYAVGVEVFDRGAEFDPRTDPVVRTEARRLRAKLAEYYSTHGNADPVEIQLPKGSYCPVFVGRTAAEPPPAHSPRKKSRAKVVLVAGAALLGIVLGHQLWTRLRQPVEPPQPSIAVLPLENLSGDAEQEYFADGMTEALTTELAKLGTLRVISTTSAMQYKRKKASVPKIAADLNVDYVVEGSVTRAGNRVRIRAQLIEARVDRHRWADDFDSDLGDILRLQSDLARAIVREMWARLAPKERRRSSPARAVHPEAYLSYLRGRYHWYKRTPQGVRTSVEHFKQAIDYDAGWAPAYAGLADAYNLLASYHLADAGDVYPKARAAAERALEIDDTLPEAHTAFASILSDYYWDWEGAEKHFQRALALNPNHALAHMWYAGFLAYNRKRAPEALVEARRARDLDPLSLIAHNTVGFVLYHAREFDAAIEQLRKVREMDPAFPPSYLHLGLAWLQKRDYAQAVSALESAVKLSGDDPNIAADLAYALALSGKKEKALELLHDFEARSRRGENIAMALAIAYTGLGDKELAFQWFDKAVEERQWLLTMLPTEPLYDPLRSDPRFERLLRKLNLAS